MENPHSSAIYNNSSILTMVQYALVWQQCSVWKSIVDWQLVCNCHGTSHWTQRWQKRRRIKSSRPYCCLFPRQGKSFDKMPPTHLLIMSEKNLINGGFQYRTDGIEVKYGWPLLWLNIDIFVAVFLWFALWNYDNYYIHISVNCIFL